MIENVAEPSADPAIRYLEEYFPRFDVKLTDGETLQGCRLLTIGRHDLVVESERGDKFLIPRRSITYVTLEHAFTEPSR